MSEAHFSCPKCSKRYRWKAELAGRKVRCTCGEALTVPTAAAASQHPVAVKPAKPTTAQRQSKPGVARPPLPGEATAVATANCPSCGQAVKPGAVLCLDCGFNLKTGQAMQTSVGRAVKTSTQGQYRRGGGGVRDGFFGRLSRSWQFIKIAYGILWDFKSLLVFPVLSGIAAVLVLLSFVLPLWGTGTLEQLADLLDEQTTARAVSPIVYAVVFAFYFCSYFVIVFFNTALTACALKVCAGETPTVGYGLSIAVKRLPQVIGWALLSATVGLILKIIENANEKVGAIIAAIIGTAWTVLTYFVVPVLAAEGLGPFTALQRSAGTLKQTWGEAVLGNFAMGLLTFLLTLPVYLILGILFYLAVQTQNIVLVSAVVVLFILFALLSAVVNSAADMVFRALLYNYATGRTIPEEIPEELFADAFGGKAA